MDRHFGIGIANDSRLRFFLGSVSAQPALTHFTSPFPFHLPRLLLIPIRLGLPTRGSRNQRDRPPATREERDGMGETFAPDLPAALPLCPCNAVQKPNTLIISDYY